jgi:hypothetical protein
MNPPELYALLQATTTAGEIASFWEIAKGVLLFSITGLLAWIANTLRDMVKRQVVLEHIVVGMEGTNGLRSRMGAAEERIDLIEDRNLVIDAVAKAEEEQYKGEERRHGLRRLRDLIRDEIEHPERRPAT